MSQKPSIPQTLLYNMIAVTLLSTVIVGSFWILNEYNHFNQSASVLFETSLEARKALMKEQVDQAVNTIQHRRGQAEENLKRALRTRVIEAHAVAERLYTAYQDRMGRPELEQLIGESLRAVPYDDERGCFFAMDKNGILEVSSEHPEQEGTSAVASEIEANNAATRALLTIGREAGEGYHSFPGTDDSLARGRGGRTVYVKQFAPLDWTIGAAEYPEFAERELQTEVLAWIDGIRFGNDYYLFAGQWDGLSLSGPAHGQNMLHITDPTGVRIVQSLIQCAQSGGGFISYVMPKLEGQRPEPKISYAQGIEGWDWYIGTGVYTDDIVAAVAGFRAEKLADLQRSIAGIFLLLLVLVLGSCFFVARMARKTRRAFEGFFDFFDRASRGQAESLAIGAGFREFEALAHSANRMLGMRRAAEEALRHSEQRLQILFARAADAMYVADMSGRLIQVNEQACASTGYSEVELLGMNVVDVDADTASPEDLRTFFGTLAPGRAATLASRHRRNDGSTFPVEITVALLETPDGPYVFGIARDVSERLRADSERQQLEIQLQQSQKMEAIGQLTGGVAHDFNNLLQVINAGADIALTDIAPDHAARPVLEEVVRAGERAANLVRQLLAFSRRQIMRLESLDLNPVVEDVLKLIHRLIGEHIHVEWVPGENLGTVNADRGMVEQAVMNLCVNARDAMPEGGVLRVETDRIGLDEAYCAEHPWAEPGCYVRLTVRDTGSGMDAITLDRVFEPFFSTKPEGKGTGLGLSTVYGIVKQHSGLIHASSAPGAGATFELYWPLTATAIAERLSPVVQACRGGNETILMAEDDEMVRNLSQKILAASGYTVIVARDGEEAVRLFQEQCQCIDLVMLDVVMPRMGGREAYERMCALRPGLKSLFASGYSESAIDKNFVLEGGLQLLQKPFTREPLLRAVRAVLDGVPAPRRN